MFGRAHMIMTPGFAEWIFLKFRDGSTPILNPYSRRHRFWLIAICLFTIWGIYVGLTVYRLIFFIAPANPRNWRHRKMLQWPWWLTWGKLSSQQPKVLLELPPWFLWHPLGVGCLKSCGGAALLPMRLLLLLLSFSAKVIRDKSKKTLEKMCLPIV